MADTAKPKATGKTGSRRRAARNNADSHFNGEKPEVLLDYYRQMLLIRRFEERAAQAYTQARIGGYCHLNLGEEATIVGLMEALQERDYLFTNYREHGYAIAKGTHPREVMAELYGRSTGVSSASTRRSSAPRSVSPRRSWSPASNRDSARRHSSPPRGSGGSTDCCAESGRWAATPPRAGSSAGAASRRVVGGSPSISSTSRSERSSPPGRARG